MKRHVFLDNDTDEQALLKQFSKAMRVAKKQGKVVLIGHPYPETLAFLEKNLSLLDEHNIQLKRLDTYFQEKLWRPFHRPNTYLSIYQLQYIYLYNSTSLVNLRFLLIGANNEKSNRHSAIFKRNS